MDEHALLQDRVERDLAGQHPHVFDAEIAGTASSAQGVSRLRELLFQHKIQLRRQHLATLVRVR